MSFFDQAGLSRMSVPYKHYGNRTKAGTNRTKADLQWQFNGKVKNVPSYLTGPPALQSARSPNCYGQTLVNMFVGLLIRLCLKARSCPVHTSPCPVLTLFDRALNLLLPSASLSCRLKMTLLRLLFRNILMNISFLNLIVTVYDAHTFSLFLLRSIS